VLALLLAACLAGATAALFLTAPPANDSPEAGFARDMMVHHTQAVQMAGIVRDKTQSDEIRFLATDMVLTQQAQIGQMQGWLSVWELPVVGTEPAMGWMEHPTEGLMPGMATTEEIGRLYDAPPEEADELFLRLMIPHHRAAVPMAEAVLKETNHPAVEGLAVAIASSQKAEIEIMQGMLRDMGAPPVREEEAPADTKHTHM
jgi:uncharacterized protein (DUF305 family)